MTPKEINSEVRKIKAKSHDDEGAHSSEDHLRHRVLEAIASGAATDPVACAKAVLKTSEIDFARWCA